MKRLSFLLLFILGLMLHAQNYPFSEKWEKVNTEFAEGKFKSVEPLLNEIYARAKQENNAENKIKALIFRAKIAIQTSDDEDVATETEKTFLKEIANTEDVGKAVLQSLLAELYFNYYQENQYRIHGRTDLDSAENTDFRTWDTARFLKEIDVLLQNSLTPKKLLTATEVTQFEQLLQGEDKWRFLRPKMFDLLANRALNIYENHLFKNQKFNQDVKEEQIQKLYGDLVEIHQKDKNPSALIEAQLNKIQYDFTDDSNSETYREALANLYQKYNANEWSTNVLYKLADYQKRKNDYVEAVEICKQAIQQFPKSLGANRCQQLKSKIETPYLSFSTDNTLFANQYNPLYISHKNTDKIYYQIYQLTPNQLVRCVNGFDFDNENKKLKTVGSPIKTGEIALKKFTDYQRHSTKIPFEPLAAGNYILVLANNPNFRGDVNNCVFQTAIISTQIDLTTRDMRKGNKHYNQAQILNKNNGKPLKNQKATIFYTQKKNPFKHFTNITSDDFGRFNLDKEGNWDKKYYLKLPQEATYFPIKMNYYKGYRNKKEWEKESVVFTDRGIYRPGQTVYFKAILYKSKGKERQIAPNEKVEITLNDVNDKEVAKLALVSNEFGSVHGEFILPNSGLTGEFYLDNDWSFDEKNIQVEEYKRPKFKAAIDTLKGVYQLGDKVSVSGKAQTFSGANVSDAQVTYRVFRKAYNPYFYWRSVTIETEEEITQGKTTTNADGVFEFDFNAKPDKAKKGSRAYIYKIVADVVDVSGETHTAEGDVKIGDIPYQLGLIADEKTTDFHSLEIKTTNLNGAKITAKGNLKITEILPLDRVLRSEQQKVDYELIPKSESVEKLPYIAYENDYLLKNRVRGKVLVNENWDTEKTEEIKWNKNLKAGKYEVIATSIYQKDTIENVRIVEVFKKNKSLDNQIYFAVNLNKNEFQPNDKAEITFTSDAKNANVLVELEADGKIVKREVLKLNNTDTFDFKIEENYRGNVFVHAYFNKFNESKNVRKTIVVPYKNKKLNITTATLRNKLKTGEEETWELTIKDHWGDKILAEVLAGMYDKSLDEFATNNWRFFPYTSNYSSVRSWSSENSVYFKKYNYKDYVTMPRLTFEDLGLFGLSLNENIFMYEASVLEEVVVVGYSKSVRKSRVSEAVVAEPMADTLQGRVAGVEIDGAPGANSNIKIRGNASLSALNNPLYVVDGKIVTESEFRQLDENNITNLNVLKGSNATALYGANGANGVILITTKNGSKQQQDLSQIQARKNLQATAFFFPNLKTDENGNVKISFTSPESLTAWNFQTLAHTQDLKIGTFQSEIITQKELMVVPNAPRFLREGDKLTFKTKIINLTESALNGEAKLMLFDAFTMQPIETKFKLKNQQQNFEVSAGGNTSVAWHLDIPNIDEVQSVVYRIVAGTENFSDGEENALPILTNRTLVTETMPMSVRENQTKTFTFERLKNSTSDTQENFKLTMEMTTNPIWYAVLALPYLREYPYECSEQTFARFYGNVISQNIVNANPKIKAVFDDWNKKDALISPLENNEELKNILLEETPWVRDAQNETEQMKRIALLFDLNQMRNELQNTFAKLEQKQARNGGFPWFEGGQESVYITTHIVSGLGHLNQMGIHLNENLNIQPEKMTDEAIAFIDAEMLEDWEDFQRDKELYSLSDYDGMYWLYARSYFLKTHPLSNKLQAAKDYFITELNQNKFNKGLQQQAMLALVLHRYGKTQEAQKLIFAIKDRAVESDEMGMYWKTNVSGYRWYQAPVETQAMLIEAFDEITPTDIESVESMKVWLLKNKQTNQWNSTKATTEAVYALMNTGKDWTNAEDGVRLKIGGEIWQPKDAQAQSGYIKQAWNAQEITPQMATVEIEKTSPGVAWGAMYWQYFEDLDKISSANTDLKFNKQLFIQRNTPEGVKLFKINEDSPIKIGDLLKVRLEIQTDRAMDFVHIKDMRASGFEPVNVLSNYKWQDGLGYYESTRDAATNFFIDHLPKGVYVFEYELRANNAGTFSNGITQMQNMYAPEFSAHSAGMSVEIE